MKRYFIIFSGIITLFVIIVSFSYVIVIRENYYNAFGQKKCIIFGELLKEYYEIHNAFPIKIIKSAEEQGLLCDHRGNLFATSFIKKQSFTIIYKPKPMKKYLFFSSTPSQQLRIYWQVGDTNLEIDSTIPRP